MEKGHKRKYLHRIGVIVIEFHSFGESLFLLFFTRKRWKDIRVIELNAYSKVAPT
jgi:hypothetical protein